MKVRLDKVSKLFGKTAAVDNVSLEIADGELFFLLGPSGCGKTTLLRLLAGFYQPDAGQIFFGDHPMNAVAPERRNCGMVFQNYALWPHMTVEGNVAYGLDVRKIKAEEKEARVREALQIVKMSEYASRPVNQLSGGQQQRVALARAIVIRPDVLLLDEPLSNLDARLRLSMRNEIRRIHAQTRITTFYVTHDQSEALSMADHIAILNQGKIEQIGTPAELYCKPDSPFAADFMGEINWIDAVVEEPGNGRRVCVRSGEYLWEVASSRPWIKGTEVRIGFRPESVSFSHGAAENSFPATVLETFYLGAQQETLLKTGFPGDQSIRALEINPGKNNSADKLKTVSIDAEQILIFEKSSK